MTNVKEDNDYSKAFLEALNESTCESIDRNERWERVFAADRKKWPNGIGSLPRDQVPKELLDELDRCIEKSQKIAMEACQTVELTAQYFENNNE